MARKNIVDSYRLVEVEGENTFGDMSQDFTSKPYEAKNQDNVSYQVNWSGTGVSGEYFIEGTNHDLDDPNITVQWTVLDFGLQMLVAADTDGGGDLVSINQCPFSSLRFRYEAAGGTGTMTVFLTSKQVGG